MSGWAFLRRVTMWTGEPMKTTTTNQNEPAAPPTTRRTYDFAISRYVRCADCDRWRSADIATCQCGSRRLAIINPDAPEEAQS